ncbi:hypothetical protein ACNYMP_10145 [Ligilactobacillus salivarius]|jgi:hypothetical protein|uniref:hypothetical protein n=1 Tax=Ligilactobacillus salivarius TaxID=1624 RepID=UPI001899885F|nr:hypothetical protein [Ligilactobacillus salivarius]MDE7522867.1 hypothetical protein [Ligilactobacillus salivarius]
MNDEEMHKMYLTHFLYKNGIIEPKPEVKENKKSDGQEVKIFLVNGKTLYFDNVSSVKELDENDKMVLLIKHFDDETNKKRISCFDLSKENIIGYSIDDEL